MLRLMGSASVVEGCFFDGSGRTPTQDDRWFEICGTASNNLISGNRFDYSGGKAQLYIGQVCQGQEIPGAQVVTLTEMIGTFLNLMGAARALMLGVALW